MPICRQCGKKFKAFDNPFNIVCKKCKRKTFKMLVKSIGNKIEYFIKENELSGIDYTEEYKFSVEDLPWVNNKRYSTDYWMYN